MNKVLGLVGGLTLLLAPAARAAVAINSQDRVLILSPHPDDDILGCGGIIQEAVQRKVPVRVVYLTYGDNYEWAFLYYKKRPVLSAQGMQAMGMTRSAEARAGEQVLGVPPEQTVFLGYPDWGTEHIWTDHWGASRPPLRSMMTRVTAVPYRNAYRPGAPYRGEEIIKDLEDILLDFKPTKVFVSHPADGHRDHRAFYLFSQIALWDLEDTLHPEVFPYLVHHPRWPAPRGFKEGRHLTPPQDFHELTWISVPLTPPQLEKKRLALEQHKTQMVKDHAYLLSFVADNELFGLFSPISLKDEAAVKDVAPRDLPAHPTMEGSDSDVLDLAWRQVRREGDRLVLHMAFSQPLFGSNEHAVLYLFGYRDDASFEDMPKIRVVLRPKVIRVFDQETEVRGHGIEVARTPSSVTLRIPLELLGHPQRLIGTAWSRRVEDATEWRAWRVIVLEDRD